MNRNKLIEPIGFIVAAVTLIFSLILFYSDTKSFLGSLAAASMAAGLNWLTYIVLRLILLTMRK